MEFENKDMFDYVPVDDPSETDFLAHSGVGHLDGGHSGRYPWGSGDNPHQHGAKDFLARVSDLRKSGITYVDEKDGKTYSGDTAIAKSMGLTTSQLRTEISLATNEQRAYMVKEARTLKEKGYGNTEIGKKLGGINESSVRSLLNSDAEARMNAAYATADFLKNQVDKKRMIDVGVGIERELNVSKEKLNTALYLLEREGYHIYKGGVPQPTNPGQQINQKVLASPDVQHKEIYDFSNVKTINRYISRDGGDSFEKKFNYPASLDSKRLKILLKDEIGPDGETGSMKDGIVQLRRGVPDLSLGDSKYAQVRILVDGDKYIKGMAVYSDNMPKGIDVIFNTSKSSYDNALKPIKNDPDNPFGSLIKDADQGGQYWYDSKTGKRLQSKAESPNAKLGLINKRADEGDWTEWKDQLPSQFLAKQPVALAKKQINLAISNKNDEYNEIMNINNPTVRKHFLKKFADECDSTAVHLQAAALPSQKYHVIIPINSLKDNEIYAPGYEDGSKLALVRYPHGGTFEIPILTVKNKGCKTGDTIIGKQSIDAVGINKKIADMLSGADFDGDTVMCIPTGKSGINIKNSKPLADLEGFDSKFYQYDEKRIDNKGNEHYYRQGREFKVMTNTDNEMGRISNLIMDMTLAGATDTEKARAVKHSMVVIDAEKHKLDYRQSEIDNNISQLRRIYQPHISDDGKTRYGGASTLLTQAKGQTYVLKRQGTPKVNLKGKDYYDPSRPEGALIYKTATNLEYTKYRRDKKTGAFKAVPAIRQQKSTKMMETDDANTLVSPAKHPMELLYANYANSMKSLANKARVEYETTGKIAYSPQAKKIYNEEVKSLNDKLNIALLNAPKEREAARRANTEVSNKTKNNWLDKDTLKKAKQQAMTSNRAKLGASSRLERNIKLTLNEWKAIQAGAVSETTLKKILNNSDVDVLRSYATPKKGNVLSPVKVNRIKSMIDSGYTLEQISKALNISTSTVSKYK